ncbi:hypothetical protein ATO6_04415 [Oceanicola sp. 22II-s10i]|uniref:DUF4178 domain-containing protein n=1 Tax=Oceanicola sp. 22II-s10i TaxID=1317116 RepID=UPI000B51F962|nr:DUF4178 domain-containing protein [Oceanicola sp. 22II-s10i]OWU86109.1 hypothetical protein ATO6_04415 [Oceanicola sp. 22II-s10i]
MADHNCPNCGDRIDPRMAGFRHVVCPSCGTSLLIEDEAVRQAGQAGVMHDAPMLFGLGDRVNVWGKNYDILGHARFSYGRGWWDEFQAVNEAGSLFWLSVDEGDVAIQAPLPQPNWPKATSAPALGAQFSVDGRKFNVTEAERAECLALRGAFDEELTVGETYDFVNCAAANGALLSGEFWPGGRSWFIGNWADPFDIRVERAT